MSFESKIVPNSMPEIVLLQEAAFLTSLSLLEIGTRYWRELKKILPADELHLIDPYILDAGGQDAAVYAGNVTALLKPALMSVQRVIFMHAKPREGIREILQKNIAFVDARIEVEFQKGTNMHARYVVADRARAIRMEFSFNRIGKHFGTVSLVEDTGDLAGVLDELERLHPASV